MSVPFEKQAIEVIKLGHRRSREILKRLFTEEFTIIQLMGLAYYWGVRDGITAALHLEDNKKMSSGVEHNCPNSRVDQRRALEEAVAEVQLGINLLEGKTERKDHHTYEYFISMLNVILKEVARIQWCQNGHEYVADSHEYPCPICQNR